MRHPPVQPDTDPTGPPETIICHTSIGADKLWPSVRSAIMDGPPCSSVRRGWHRRPESSVDPGGDRYVANDSSESPGTDCKSGPRCPASAVGRRRRGDEATHHCVFCSVHRGRSKDTQKVQPRLELLGAGARPDTVYRTRRLRGSLHRRGPPTSASYLTPPSTLHCASQDASIMCPCSLHPRPACASQRCGRSGARQGLWLARHPTAPSGLSLAAVEGGGGERTGLQASAATRQAGSAAAASVTGRPQLRTAAAAVPPGRCHVGHAGVSGATPQALPPDRPAWDARHVRARASGEAGGGVGGTDSAGRRHACGRGRGVGAA